MKENANIDDFDRLFHEKIYEEAKNVTNIFSKNKKLKELTATAPKKWIKQTSDGWLKVRRADNNSIISLPSHLEVSYLGNSRGRDKAVVEEGLWTGLEVTIASGYLVGDNPSYGKARMVFKNAESIIEIDGVSYDRLLSIWYQKSGNEVFLGDYPATTDQHNPVPVGEGVVEIPDYPHCDSCPSSYGDYRKIWFRIGSSGDRYIHPGRISAGCITCAPRYWDGIYDVLIRTRLNFSEIGKIKVSQQN